MEVMVTVRNAHNAIRVLVLYRTRLVSARRSEYGNDSRLQGRSDTAPPSSLLHIRNKHRSGVARSARAANHPQAVSDPTTPNSRRTRYQSNLAPTKLVSTQANRLEQNSRVQIQSPTVAGKCDSQNSSSGVAVSAPPSHALATQRYRGPTSPDRDRLGLVVSPS